MNWLESWLSILNLIIINDDDDDDSFFSIYSNWFRSVWIERHWLVTVESRRTKWIIETIKTKNARPSRFITLSYYYDHCYHYYHCYTTQQVVHSRPSWPAKRQHQQQMSNNNSNSSNISSFNRNPIYSVPSHHETIFFISIYNLILWMIN